MGKNIEIGEKEALAWDSSDVPASLAKLKAYVESQAEHASDWYLQRKRMKAAFSRYMRLGAIFATAGGALVPIAAELFPQILPAAAKTGLLPSLLVGLAAALLGADRAFGFSSGWIRYITTAATIRRALEEFRMDWLVKTSQLAAQPTPDQIIELLQLAKSFRLAIEGQVMEETKAWAAEFQSSLAQLEKQAQAQSDQQRAKGEESARKMSEAQRLGSLEVSVSNGTDADEQTVQLQLDDGDKPITETLIGSTRWARVGLKPGQYKIVVSAKAGRRQVNDSAVCEVLPGQVVKAELRLPIAPLPPAPPAGPAGPKPPAA